MIFFEVPTATALAEAEANKDKVARKANKFYVQLQKSDVTLGTTTATIKEFPVLTIQAGKSLHISLEVPMRNESTSWGGAYINTSVRINGGTWYNLGNSGYCTPVMMNGCKGIGKHCESKALDFITGLGLDPLADYTVQFYISGRSYNGTLWINKSSEINSLHVTGRGASRSMGTDQNFMRLIVQEID